MISHSDRASQVIFDYALQKAPWLHPVLKVAQDGTMHMLGNGPLPKRLTEIHLSMPHFLRICSRTANTKAHGPSWFYLC